MPPNIGRPLRAPSYCPPTSGRLLVAAHYRPPTTCRLPLLARYWPSTHSLPPTSGLALLAAYYWPATVVRLLFPAYCPPHRTDLLVTAALSRELSGRLAYFWPTCMLVCRSVHLPSPLCPPLRELAALHIGSSSVEAPSASQHRRARALACIGLVALPMVLVWHCDSRRAAPGASSTQSSLTGSSCPQGSAR